MTHPWHTKAAERITKCTIPKELGESYSESLETIIKILAEEQSKAEQKPVTEPCVGGGECEHGTPNGILCAKCSDEQKGGDETCADKNATSAITQTGDTKKTVPQVLEESVCDAPKHQTGCECRKCDPVREVGAFAQMLAEQDAEEHMLAVERIRAERSGVQLLSACPFCEARPERIDDDYRVVHQPACFFTQQYAQEMWLVGKKRISQWNTCPKTIPVEEVKGIIKAVSYIRRPHARQQCECAECHCWELLYEEYQRLRALVEEDK